jgi:hypothetical protein
MMILFILDACFGLSTIMRHKEFSAELFFVYFNILVMNVFNLTQFHLYFWFVNLILKILAKVVKNKWLSLLIEFLNKILNVIWIKFD